MFLGSFERRDVLSLERFRPSWRAIAPATAAPRRAFPWPPARQTPHGHTPHSTPPPALASKASAAAKPTARTTLNGAMSQKCRTSASSRLAPHALTHEGRFVNAIGRSRSRIATVRVEPHAPRAAARPADLGSRPPRAGTNPGSRCSTNLAGSRIALPGRRAQVRRATVSFPIRKTHSGR
jgi:hypothetical protein